AGEELFRRRKNSVFAEFGDGQGRISATLAGVFVGEYVDSDFSSLQPPLLVNPGYNTWDARGSVAITKQIAGLLAIDNIADAGYMEPLGYQALGRAVRGGIRVGF